MGCKSRNTTARHREGSEIHEDGGNRPAAAKGEARQQCAGGCSVFVRAEIRYLDSHPVKWRILPSRIGFRGVFAGLRLLSMFGESKLMSTSDSGGDGRQASRFSSDDRRSVGSVLRYFRVSIFPFPHRHVPSYGLDDLTVEVLTPASSLALLDLCFPVGRYSSPLNLDRCVQALEPLPAVRNLSWRLVICQ